MPPFRNSSRGEAVVLFLHSGVCSTYCGFERAPRPRSTFYRTFYKLNNYKNVSRISSPKRQLCGLSFSDLKQTCGAIRLPQTQDGLRCAETLRPGPLRTTLPARPPGQPRTGSFQIISMVTTSGQQPIIFFENIQPRPPGQDLSAEMCGPERPPLQCPLRYL